MQPIHTALLSFGMSGQVFHAPFLHAHPGFHLHAVWERSKNLASEKYPEVKTYRKLEEVLGDDSIELVIVNTPSYSHFDYAKQALLAGRHVVVEKPFTATVAEGEELVRIAQEKNLHVSVFQNRRYDSDFRLVKKIVEDQLLGELVEVEFHYDRYKLELSPKQHKETQGPGAGVLYDLGSHIIDQALMLFGMPDSVYADIRSMRPASRVDDYFELILYYPGLVVRLHSTYVAREPLPAYILHGTRGSFLKHRGDVQEASLQLGVLPGSDDYGQEPESLKGLLHTEVGGEVIRKQLAAPRGNYMDYYGELFRAIRLGTPLPVTATDGLNVIRIIEAAKGSHLAKKQVEIS